MLGFGIYEVIVLALALSGFGVEPNPKAPTADAVLEYAVGDSDIVGYVDAVPLIPGNYTALTRLPTVPEIRDNQMLRELVGKAIAEVEGARGTVKTVIGVDLTTDLANITMFAKLSTPPQFLVVARGRFPADMPMKIAKMMGGNVETIGGGQAVTLGAPLEMLAINKAGVLLVGSRALVTERLAAGWKPPARPSGSILNETARLLADKPFYLLAASSASGRLMKQLRGATGDEPAVYLERFVFAAAALYHNGLSWVLVDKDSAGHARSVMASEGYVDLLRAMQLAPRGFAKVVMSLLDDVPGTDPQLAALKQHKADLLKLVDQFSGDGNFRVKLDKDGRGHRVAVRATGKRLSDVVPFGVIVPAMAAGVWSVASGGSSEKPATSIAAPPPVKARPSGVAVPKPKRQPQPRKPAPRPATP